MIDKEILTSVYGKLSAIGFIGLILVGNFWLVYLITNTQAPRQIELAFAVCIIVCLVGCAGMILQVIYKKIIQP